MFDMCVTWDPKEQEELRCQVLSGYAIICQEAGISLASWQDHTHCGKALTFPHSWPLTPSAISTSAQLCATTIAPHGASCLGSPSLYSHHVSILLT